MLPPTKITSPTLPKFDWSALDVESFRGPGLSFPVKVELVMAPSFTIPVLGAMNSFVEYYAGSFIDPEYDGFIPKLLDNMPNAEGGNEALGENDLGIRMIYICGYTRVVIMTMRRPEDLITKH